VKRWFCFCFLRYCYCFWSFSHSDCHGAHKFSLVWSHCCLVNKLVGILSCRHALLLLMLLLLLLLVAMLPKMQQCHVSAGRDFVGAAAGCCCGCRCRRLGRRSLAFCVCVGGAAIKSVHRFGGDVGRLLAMGAVVMAVRQRARVPIRAGRARAARIGGGGDDDDEWPTTTMTMTKCGW
jgi:hypothetical protein